MYCALFEAGMLCHLVSWASCHWTTHWHFVSFIQNTLHNISHTHLLTVPNTVGSVSAPSETGCQATNCLCSTVFSFCLPPVNIACLLDPLLSTMENSPLFCFSLSHCGAPPVVLALNLFAACLFKADKVTH